MLNDLFNESLLRLESINQFLEIKAIYIDIVIRFKYPLVHSFLRNI